MKWSVFYKEFLELAEINGFDSSDVEDQKSKIKKWWDNGYSLQESIEIFTDMMD